MRNNIPRIAFVLPNFQAGGAERVMATVANHLDRRRFQPLIIVFHDHGPLREIVAQDIEIISLDHERVSRGAFAFARTMRARQPDLIISTMAHLNMIVLLMKPFMPKIPVIVREAVTPSYFSGHFFKRSVLTLGYYLLYPFADKILSPTQLVFDEMPSFLKQKTEKLCRIFNPVNTDLLQKGVTGGLRESLARPDQRLFIGAGRLVSQKGFDRLIECLKGWKDRDDWRLVILGDGPDQEKLQQMIDREGLRQIALAGFESRPGSYFAVADAFLLPSRHEGLPNVVLEALALGAPVIAADSAGGIAEIEEQAVRGSVRLARDMDEFQVLMQDVKPSSGFLLRKSLLPACFSLADVVASYENVFTALLPVTSQES